MINVKFPRRGFVVEEVIEGCKTEGCPAKKLVVIPYEDYGEENFNELTDGMTRGQNACDHHNEGACPICKKAVTFNQNFIVTSDVKTLETAEEAVNYAVHILKKPFPEGEALIATSVEDAYRYAMSILKAPFPLGEPVIATSAEYSYYYAESILKAPFRLGEVAIATNAEYSYRYARDVLKAVFPLGEAAIATEPYYYKEYKKLFSELQATPEPQAPAPATPEPQAPDSINIVSGFYLKEKTSMSDKQKRKQKQKDVIKNTFLTLVYTLEDIIEWDRGGGTYSYVGCMVDGDNILKRIHELMETFPNLTENLAAETYPKVKSYMDEYSKYRKEKQEKEKPNV